MSSWLEYFLGAVLGGVMGGLIVRFSLPFAQPSQLPLSPPSLKPPMQKGERLKIKIQRQGKEERQGVGYLEDGTMIVVNGGGDFIGKMIDVFVLSIKQTAAGRMIFCNVIEERYDDTAFT